MDLEAEAERLALDILAVRVCSRLDEVSIPYLLLKGPSTATWLYDPPRRYRDVDLLVPEPRLRASIEAVTGVGLAVPAAGRPGEAAHHSVLLRSANGFELDLHMTLPALPRGPEVFDVLWAHRTVLDVGLGQVWALDEPGRCLVLALHALGSGSTTGQPADDLRAALSAASPAGWDEAARLAERLDAGDLLQAGLGLVGAARDRPTTRRSRLYAAHAPSGALGLQRLAESGPRALPLAVLREILPSRELMSYAASEDLRGRALLVAHLRRWARIAVTLPAAVRSWREAGHT